MKSLLKFALVGLLVAMTVSSSDSSSRTDSVSFADGANSTNITNTTPLNNNATVAPWNATSTSVAPTSTPEPVTGGYSKYRTIYDFFYVFYQSTFEQCKVSFDEYCLPALQQKWFTQSELEQAWQQQDLQCLNTYCTCWPGGQLAKRIYNGEMSYTCQIPSSLTSQELCIAEEYCAAANYVCFMDWIYGNKTGTAGSDGPRTKSGLPAECSSFLRCTEQPNVVANTTASCLAAPPTQTVEGNQYCEMDQTCSFTTSQVNSNVTVASLLAAASAAEAALGVGAISTGTKTLTTIMLVTGLLIIFGVVLFGYAYVKYRNQVSLTAAEEAAGMLTGDELRNEAIQTAKWYGAPLVVPGPSEGTTAPVPSCVFCQSPNPKYLLLGCRCYWCGCKTAEMKSTRSGKLKKEEGKEKKEHTDDSKDASEGDPTTGLDITTTATPGDTIPTERPITCQCGSKIEEIINMSLFDNGKKAVENPKEGAAAGTHTEMRTESPTSGGDDDNDTSCVICLDSKAIVAFFPCSHRATCGGCGKRIVEGDAVARQTQVMNYAEGKKAICRCPLCRAEIEFAVVLEADVDEQNDILAALDENGFCTKPLNSLTGQERQEVVTRIKAFNQKHNPQGVRKVEDLFKYHWTEDDVMRKLMAKYAPGEVKKLKATMKNDTHVGITSQESASAVVDIPDEQRGEVAVTTAEFEVTSRAAVLLSVVEREEGERCSQPLPRAAEGTSPNNSFTGGEEEKIRNGAQESDLDTSVADVSGRDESSGATFEL